MPRRLVSGVVIGVVALVVSTCGSKHDSRGGQAMVGDLVTQARKLDLSGQQAAAIAGYRQALAHDPNSYDAHYGIARALDLVGSYDEARGHFARALELAPPGDRDQVERMLAISWTFAGNLNAADAEFRKVFDRQAAAHNFAAAAEEANEIGRLHLEFGDLTVAEAWYRRGHDVAGRAADLAQWQIDLADMRLAHARARIAARRGRAQDARQEAAVVERLIAKGGNDDQKVQDVYLQGYIHFYAGDYAEAASALISADQKDPAVLLLRAEAAEKLGRVDEAAEFYRRVLQSSAHSITGALARPVAEKRLSAVVAK